MKKSVIRDIFNGKKGDMETMHMPKDEQGEINDGILCKAYEELKEKLSPEILDLHQKIVDTLASQYCEEIDFFFTEGFKLGLLIGIECMEE